MKSQRIASGGFTLVELTIVLIIIALLISGMMVPLSAQRDIQRIGGTQKQLAEIREALFGFAIINGRLPCPATATDPADVEILNNYVYTLIKANRLQDAELEAGRLLTISPGRSSAWANLAEIYAIKNNSEEAVAALVLAFQFSSNKDRTINFLNDRAADTTSPLQATAKKTIDVIQKL